MREEPAECEHRCHRGSAPEGPKGEYVGGILALLCVASVRRKIIAPPEEDCRLEASSVPKEAEERRGV